MAMDENPCNALWTMMNWKWLVQSVQSIILCQCSEGT